MKSFCALLKKDFRLLNTGKFFLMCLGFLLLYTLYVNLGYVKFLHAEIYNVYLYDPAGTQKTASSQVQRVSSREELDTALRNDTNGVGIVAEDREVQILLYEGTESGDRHRADYALFQSARIVGTNTTEQKARIVGANTPEQKARKEITCELLFFEITAVGFLGIAAMLFREKSMGVIRVHAILPMKKNWFLLSKLLIFLLSDLVFAVLLTFFNVGFLDAAFILPEVLLQTAVLSVLMALTGLGCALFLKDFRQFTLVYLLIAVFAATPVFLSANTSVKLDWIRFHPFYHLYMGLKNAYFGTSASGPLCYLGAAGAAAALFAGVRAGFYRELGKEG